MGPSLIWRAAVPFWLLLVCPRGQIGAHATTSTVWPAFASTASDVAEDDSWFDVFSYFFASYPGCHEVMGKPEYIGDGECDYDNNNELCEYDGGDCCICTCVDAQYICEESTFSCSDPEVTEDCRQESDSFTRDPGGYDESDFPDCEAVGGNLRDIGDSGCDIENSNEECGYDGGDCCSCTCEETEDNECGSNGGYYCQDPSVSAECKEESDSYIHMVSSETGYLLSQYPGCYEAGGDPTIIGDGSCEYWNSIEECAYDGGDCCICTCEDNGEKTCGGYPGYYCQDPTVSDECKDASLTSFSSSYTEVFAEYPGCFETGVIPDMIGDGRCDTDGNTEECGYDGGDCCSCTCEEPDFGSCGQFGYFCRDPSVSAECVDESRMIVSSSYGSWEAFADDYLCDEAGGITWNNGDGECDPRNNIEECGYDGGDCCICTCVVTEWGSCGENGGYWCQDPSVSAECVEESASFVPSSTTTGSWDFEKFYEYPDCYFIPGGSPSKIGDGDCDFRNSVEECAYDGGDCCACTCVDTALNTCGENGGYYCNDPSVSEACKNESDSYIAVVPDSDQDLYFFSQYPGCYEVGGFAPFIGSGKCTPENNNEECAYDGGDCCICTCVDTDTNWCGEAGYDCQDPTVSPECVEASNSTQTASST